MDPIATIPAPATVAERMIAAERERRLLRRLYRLAVDAHREVPTTTTATDDRSGVTRA